MLNTVVTSLNHCGCQPQRAVEATQYCSVSNLAALGVQSLGLINLAQNVCMT